MLTAQPPTPGDFTQEPRESDLVVPRTPIYSEEPGARQGKSSAVTLAPCKACGVAVITGKLDSGALVTVEPQTCTYALLWASGEPYPRLTPALADLARWLQENPKRRPRTARGWKQRMGYSLNYYYEKSVWREGFAKATISHRRP